MSAPIPPPPPSPSPRSATGFIDLMMAHKVWTIAIVLVLLATIGAIADAGQDAEGGSSAAATDPGPTTPEFTTPVDPTPISVPGNLENQTLSRVRSRLQDLGLQVELVQKYSNEAPHSVLRLSADGEQVDPGTIVTVTVAQLIPKVPNVTDDPLDRARNTLQDAGYKVRVVKRTSSEPAGSIIDQTPDGGDQLIPEKMVTLFIAKPPPPQCDPNYSGYCVPVVSYDLNCDDVGSNFFVVGSDIHGFDGYDNDGIACES